MGNRKSPRKAPRFNKRSYIAQNAVKIGLLTPQAIVVLNHLIDAKTITQREALLDHSVQSLTKRISELRDSGFDIGGAFKLNPVTGQRYMKYTFNPAN